MKIDIENVYIGSIRICTKYNTYNEGTSKDCISEEGFGSIEIDSFVSRKNAKLLKVTNGGYVDLDYLNSFLDELKVKNGLKKNGGFYSGGLIIGTSPSKVHMAFVDESTLIQYEPLKEIKRPTVKKLKKTMLMDARVPGGIDW